MTIFTATARCPQTQARAGVFQTRHGSVPTPAFMPVGTQGTVKAVTPEELAACGARMILGNTYHLYLRPGLGVIGRFGGLHRFMHWDGPILTDSGGYQVFSLAALRRITPEGVLFQSHIDGSRHQLSPEKAVEIQVALDADVAMCLDQCLHYPATPREASDALELTSAWAQRCQAAWNRSGNRANRLFGIVQGGMYLDLRRRSAEALQTIGFDGYALGGLSVGEPAAEMLAVAAETLPLLPKDRPRYVMGVGTPENLVELVGLGADLFDCVLPTRNARNGQLFTARGVLNIGNARFAEDTEPIAAHCGCYTCRRFSRAYLRHLLKAGELLYHRLATLHNLHYYLGLMTQMRAAIDAGTFTEFQRDFYRQREG
jgi:queuine tRNA-ribosyltransferase